MDYRSLYHHYECATYLYKTSCISEIEKELNSVRDFLDEVPEANEKEDVYTSLIEELDALQKECNSLHKL